MRAAETPRRREWWRWLAATAAVHPGAGMAMLLAAEDPGARSPVPGARAPVPGARAPVLKVQSSGNHCAEPSEGAVRMASGESVATRAA
jgi:hypothetical protein